MVDKKGSIIKKVKNQRRIYGTPIPIVTEIQYPNFKSHYVFGRLLPKHKQQIQEILGSMSYDSYAGYSPDEQAKRDKIEEIIKGYLQPEIILVLKGGDE